MWPETLNEWLLSLSLLIGLFTTLGGLLGKWLSNKLNSATKRIDKDIDGLGERIDKELKDHLKEFREWNLRVSANKALIDAQSFEIQGINHFHRSHEKEMVELREMIRNLSRAVEDQRTLHSQELRTMVENVAGIKSTIELLLKKGASG